MTVTGPISAVPKGGDRSEPAGRQRRKSAKSGLSMRLQTKGGLGATC